MTDNISNPAHYTQGDRLTELYNELRWHLEQAIAINAQIYAMMGLKQINDAREAK